MKILLAKTAGFCFGVDRGVKMTYDLVAQGHKVATLGPLIHNDQMVRDLEEKGVITADSLDQIPDGYEVVIRCHGVPSSVYDEINTRGLVCHDATCPFVSKIHRLAEKAQKEGAVLLVAGDENHPEVRGIVGHTRGKVKVFNGLDELEKISREIPSDTLLYAVAQTTFQVTKWLECVEFIKKVYTNAFVFDTICSATGTRQQEAEDLSQKCDLMIVIGGHHSSNTQKLVQVAARYTKAVSVETAADLDPSWWDGVGTVGVTAGASTPSSIIEEVLNSMSETMEKSFAELLAESEAESNRVFVGKVVKGKVTSINNNEIYVDIGGAHTGVCKLSELTDDSSASVSDLVKVGDEMEFVVEKTNDQDGVDMLSRKKLEARKGLEEIAKACESGEVVEGDVVETNKGGVVVLVKGVKVFVPRSQATLRRDEDYTKLLKQHVQLVVTECAGRKIVGSINKVTAEANKAKREAFWANAQEGQVCQGVVKSLTSYGAFVDIGGVDGLCHISELSWNRIKHPREVMNVGDQVEVYIKELDAENQKVSLGYKKAEDNPWEKLKNEYPLGSVFTAPVVSVTDFGAFVRILPGIDGLVHISEISNTRVNKVSDVLKVGDEVSVKLMDVDFDKKRISLSMKALEAPEAEDAE